MHPQDVTATAVAEAADAIYEAARQHKRLETHHRRAARTLMQRRAALLAKAGIDLHDTAKEAQSDG